MKLVFDKYNHVVLIKIRNFLINNIKKKYKKFNNELSLLHKFVDTKDINPLRMLLFNQINKLDFKNMIDSLLGKDIQSILGEDISIQTKLNLSIQMPKDKNSILPIHSDCFSADSPFQINLWIPITDAFDTNSMYILDEKRTLDVFDKIKKNDIYTKQFFNNIKIFKKDFINLKFGQVLIFNPGLLHGNQLNMTKNTRVSLNIRLKSLFTPESGHLNADRKFGAYYKDFKIGKNTVFALKLLKTGLMQWKT